MGGYTKAKLRRAMLSEHWQVRSKKNAKLIEDGVRNRNRVELSECSDTDGRKRAAVSEHRALVARGILRGH